MAKRRKKRQIKFTFTTIILLLFLIIIVFVAYKSIPTFKNIINDYLGIKDNPNEVIVSDDLNIHFLELGNKYTGDSIYIKAGDTDILIDAGSRQSSAGEITAYLNQYVTDKKLEYVIATHADQDHISGFVGTSSVPGIFSAFTCETIIDFPLTNKNTNVLKKYQEFRDEEVSLGAKHYTALDCYNNINGAKRIYELTDSIELEILYNYYYDHQSSDENNYSVCLMINQKSESGNNAKHFLFTGDLEKKGEEYLVEYNNLPEVELFKAGHHGSPTSSNDCLLSVIKPKIICVCCCAGSDEYTSNNENMFPSQAFISRACKYTERIYVTTLATTDGYTSFNGNIVVSSTASGINVVCSNNNTLLKDSSWFKENRRWE